MRSTALRLVALAAISSTLAGTHVAHAVSPEVLWTRGAGNVLDDVVSGVAIAPDGTTYITGFFFGPTDLGGGLLAIDAYDAFVAKYDADGNHLWSFPIGGDGNDFGIDIALHPQGGVAVAGYFDSPIADFGGDDLFNLGGTDIFVARYDETGAHLWSRADGGTDDEEALGVATTSFGQVVVAGHFSGDADFGSGPHTSLGDKDVFIARFDSLGIADGSVAAGGDSSDIATDVAVDGAGNIVAVGQFEGTADFGSGPHTSLGDDDIFAMVVDGVDGAGIWSRAGGSTGQDFGNAVALDATDNVIITGSFSGEVDFGGGPLTSLGGADGFVIKLNAGGDHVWSRQFGGLLDDQGNAVAVDAASRVIVGGAYFSLNPMFGTDSLSNAGGADVCVVEYTQAGDYVCVVGEGGSGNDLAIDVDVAGFDALLVGGAFSETLSLGDTDLVSAGMMDGFVVRYGPPLVGVGTEASIPSPIGIDAAWPNPFRSGITVTFTLEGPSARLQADVLDVGGRSVRRLVPNLRDASGTVVWDGRDARGRMASPGVYFVRLTAGGVSIARRLTLIR